MEKEKLLFPLNLQLFAEGEDDEDEEVDTLDDEDFEDDEDDDKDSKDQHEDEEDSEKSTKKKQSQEENARQAQARREKEQKEREEKIAKEAYEKGKKEAELNSNKVNPFTETPIEDEYDLKIYKLQEKIKANGGDPIKDLPKELAKLEREQASKSKQEQDAKDKEEEKMKSEIKDFRTQYPNVDLKKVLEDPNFNEFAEGKLGKKPLIEVYKSYVGFKQKLGIKDEDEEIEKQARGKSTSPSSTTKVKVKKSVLDMTDEEFLEKERNESADYF